MNNLKIAYVTLSLLATSACYAAKKLDSENIVIYCKSINQFNSIGATGNFSMNFNLSKKTCFNDNGYGLVIYDSFYQCNIDINNKHYMFNVDRYTGSAIMIDRISSNAVESYDCSKPLKKMF